MQGSSQFDEARGEDLDDRGSLDFSVFQNFRIDMSNF